VGTKKSADFSVLFFVLGGPAWGVANSGDFPQLCTSRVRSSDGDRDQSFGAKGSRHTRAFYHNLPVHKPGKGCENKFV